MATLLALAAALMPAISPCAESVAIEVTPKQERTGSMPWVEMPELAPAAQAGAADVTSRAREILSLERLSFRLPQPQYVGSPLEHPSGSELRDKPETMVATVRDTAVQAETSGPPDTSSAINEVYEWLTPSTRGVERADSAAWGSVGYDEAAYDAHGWEIAGEVEIGTGTATYADNEYQEFNLSETQTTSQGNEFEFYQGYQVDHSYVNSGTLYIGGNQAINQFLTNGLLELNEEFRLYRDRDDRLNDRQEGIFELSYEPSWQCGAWELDLNYKYHIKEYETFSPRSYIQHRLRASLEHDFGSGVSAQAFTRLDDYHYSLGSTRGNNRFGLGGKVDWQVRDDLQLSAGAEREQKHYDIRKERSYDKRTVSAEVAWEPDERSTLDVEARSIDYTRDFNAAEDYKDDRGSVSYQRYLSDRLDASVRLSERRKEFSALPLDDLDEHNVEFLVNAYPNNCWNAYAGFERKDYAFANPARAYLRTGVSAGLGYTHDNVSAYLDWRSSDNSYDINTDRDYTLNTLDFSGVLDCDPSRLRVYYGVGALSQEHPMSVNDFEETRVGAAWEYEIDPQTDLTISYDSARRDYDWQNGIEETLLAAELSFEL